LASTSESTDSEECSSSSTISIQLALSGLKGSPGRRAFLVQSGVLPTAVVGLSVGAFAAAVVAEANLPCRCYLGLVRSRGRTDGDEWYPSG